MSEDTLVKDPFDELIKKKSDAIDKELVASIVGNRLTIVEDGTIIPTSQFHELTDEQKIWALLLARKILSAKGIIEEEGLGPTEISKIGGIGLSKAKRLVLTLEHLTKIKGKYIIANYAITKLKGEF